MSDTARTFPRLIVAAPHSGSGKTTVTLGLLHALAERGLAVQPFKVGPDFIDPSHHARICGRSSRNLDSWMSNDDAIHEVFTRAAEEADVSVIEGVMGLFDGYGPDDDRGSTAHIAHELAAPVVLVIDAQRMATSAAAVALGCRDFDTALDVAGVVFNNVGGPGHYDWLRKSLAERAGMKALGYLPFDAALKLEERHLGLVPAAERDPQRAYYERLADQFRQHVDIEAIIDIARRAPALSRATPKIFPSGTSSRAVRIGVAYDRALNFYYQENLDLLSSFGADIVRFSLLDDDTLPPGLHGIYLGGGFPETVAADLASRHAMKESLRAFHRSGGVIYAECGGLMVLCEAIVDFDGVRHEMVGLVPAQARMSRDQLSLGYVEVETLKETALAPAGERYRAQTFHYSILENARFEPVLELRQGGKTSADGYVSGGLFATYVHAYFAGHPQLAGNLVDRCGQYAASLAKAD